MRRLVCRPSSIKRAAGFTPAVTSPAARPIRHLSAAVPAATGGRTELIRSNRRGIALMGVLVALAILAAMMTATLCQILATRRTLESREFELQAVWLARSGVERAAAQLLAGSDAYRGETLELVPRSLVQIEVKPDDGNPDTFLITIEARYPADIEDAVVRSMTRRFRREVDGGSVRLRALNDWKM